MAEERATERAGASPGRSRKKPNRARASGNPRASLEGHYRTLLDTIPHWVLETDAAGVVTFANRAYEEANGWRTGEVVGKSIFELPPTPEARESLRSYFESMAAGQPEPTPWFGQARNQRGEIRDRRADWRYLRDEKGKLSGIVAVVTDITEQLREQRRIQEKLDLLETMVDSASDIIYAKDLDGVYRRTNRAGAALVGRPREEVIGCTDEAFLTPERAALVRASDLRVLEGGEDVTSETEIETPTGVRVLSATKSPHRDAEGRVIGLVGVARDITEGKRAAEILRERSDELEASRDRYRLLVETIPHGIEEVSVDGTVLFANRAHHRMLGYDDGELIGQSMSVLSPTNEEWEQLRAYLRVLAEEQPPPTPWFGKTPTKDGRFIETRVDWNYRRDADGAVQGFVAIVTDITEQESAKATAQEHLHLLEAIIENSADAIYLKDRDSVYRLTNSAGSALVGRTPTQVVGRTDRDFFPEDVAAYVRANDLQVMERGEALTSEDTIGTPDGTRVMLSIKSPYRDGQGRVVGLVGISRDITERKSAEKRLQDSEARYRLFLENFTGIAYQAELHTYRPLFFHGRVEEITGYTSDDFVDGRVAWEDLVHPDDLGALAAEDHALTERPGYVADAEYRIQTRDGELHWVRDVARLLSPQDSGTQVIQGAIYDITKRKRTEERLQRAHEELESRVRERTAELEVAKRELELDIERREKAELEKAHLEAKLRHSQALEAVGRLAGGVAHDFNNLLGSVLACASVARRPQAKPEDVHRELHRIEELCKQGGEVTGQLLAVARRTPEATVPLDLKRKLERLRLLVERACPKTVSVVFELAEDLPRVSGDRGLVTTALLNVCLNARDAMPTGGTLTVRARREQGARRDWAVIEVTDTGEGIALELQERIFQPFFSTKSVGRGAGLGLPTALATAESMGGTLDLESKPGYGSTFTFRLPASPEPAETSAPHLGPEQDLQCLGTKSGSVLLVEDEEDIARFVTEVFVRHGCKVLRARTGLEALEILRERECSLDLILLDLVLPELSGETIYRVLTATAPNIPVLFVTGREDLATKADPKVPLLRKPFSEGDLLECARKAVGGGERLNGARPA